MNNKLIKNYTTTIPAQKTIGEIQELLAKNGATGIATEYNDEGKITDLFFRIKVNTRVLSYKLPVRTDKINAALEQAGYRIRSKPEDVAWRICKSWLEDQITLINLEQVKMEEVFLPYMIMSDNKTLFEKMQHNQFALPSGA